jgi:hypothetical protein
VRNISLSDMGNGVGLYAMWNRSKESDLAGYRVYVGTNSNDYNVFYNSSDTIFIIPGLTFGTTYYVGISAVDTKGNESVSLEKSATPAIIPKTPLGFNLGPFYGKIKVKWHKNTEYDLLGYNIYRSTISGQNFVKINSSPVRDSVYIDSLVNAGIYYYYKMTAIDSLLNESTPTVELRGKTATFDKGILIVDDSEGGLLNPTDMQVDNYFNFLLSGYLYSNYDACQLKTISIDTMGQYSSILWHIENSMPTPVLYTKINEVKKYLDAGGKMLLTVECPSRVIQHNLTYPLNLSAGNTMFDYMKIKKVELSPTARFKGAKPLAPGYDSVYIDLQKTPPDDNHHIKNIEAIYANNLNANNIYLYDTQYDTSSLQGSMKNRPVGVEYTGNDFKVVTLSFPLYYMDSIQSKQLVDYVLYDKFHEPLEIKEKTVANCFGFTLSPNPVKSQAFISYNLSENSMVNISIYNMTGVLVKIITDKNQNLGLHQLEFSVSDLTNGVYLCKMTTGNSSVTRKVVIVK